MKLPKREILTSSSRAEDGLIHAHYPTATRTLCGEPIPPRRAGRPGVPDCRPCRRTARVFEAIDYSTPRWWFQMTARQRAKLREGIGEETLAA